LSTTPNGRARGRRSEVRGQINQSPCSVRHSRDPPPMRQFSPLEDTSDTHRAHGSTRSRHKRASSRAPKPNMSRDRKACPPRSQLASSPFNQQARPAARSGSQPGISSSCRVLGDRRSEIGMTLPVTLRRLS
jgi:hypothetical protein